MSPLLIRTLSQGLQAFLPVLVCLAHFRRYGRADRVRAIQWGIAGAAVATPFAGQWFQQSAYQARWEAGLATAAAALALGFGLQVWGGRLSSRLVWGRQHRTTWGIGLAAFLLVVRQTMEIEVALKAAVMDVRSLEATLAICTGVTLALAIGWAFARASRRFPDRAFSHATSTFAAVFLAQAAVYAFHEAAEARLLPWSDVLHQSTEVYGPDGPYGLYVSCLLVILPAVSAAWTLLPNTIERISLVRIAGNRPATVAGGIVAMAGVLIVANDGGRVIVRDAHTHSSESARDVATIDAGPHLLFRHTGIDSDYSKLATTLLASPGVTRAASGLSCDRVSFAHGRGICLHSDRGFFTTYTAVIFDDSLTPRASIKLDGSPSRTRLSPDGRVGAFTVFLAGTHSYSSASLSTKTTVIDMTTGDELGDLEQFSTWRDGARFRAADFNFWGMTFGGDGNTFYASLRTGGVTYLVKGELGLRKMTVLRDNVECPSLSPDNRVIAFKKRVGSQLAAWRLYTLDLATMTERPIAGEARFVDDQIEWLDNTHVLYAIRRPGSSAATLDVWVSPIDATTPARVFLEQAESPVVVR